MTPTDGARRDARLAAWRELWRILLAPVEDRGDHEGHSSSKEVNDITPYPGHDAPAPTGAPSGESTTQ